MMIASKNIIMKVRINLQSGEVIAHTINSIKKTIFQMTMELGFYKIEFLGRFKWEKEKKKT